MPKYPDRQSSVMRLQRFLAQCGVASRRHAEELIVAGRVKVNGVVQKVLGTTVNVEKDLVHVDGEEISAVKRGVLLLNKPPAVVSTMKDPHGRTSVSKYLSKHYRSYFPVGRLDYESTGLLIFTNDGEMAERLLHPRFGFERIYEVEVEGRVSPKILEKLAQGVTLDDGKAAADAKIVANSDETTILRVVITEGRNRIVRRMFEMVGHPVLALHRSAHGPFRLGKLKFGEIRRLEEREYATLRREVLKGKITAPKTKSRR